MRKEQAGSAVGLSWPGRREARVVACPEMVVEREVGDSAGAGLLLHCDNLDAMAWVAARQRAGEMAKAALIYIDPPYAMEAKHRIDVERDGAVQSEVAYSDYWGEPAKYLQFMWDRLVPMRELLAEDGALCVHCDWRADAWLRVMLDEVFGRECFRNEVVWRRAPNLGHQAAARQLGRTTDTILVYTRTAGCEMRGVMPVRSAAVELTKTGRPRGATWDAERKAWFTTAPRGDYTDASMAALREQGRVHETASGKQYVKYFLRQGEDGRWYKDQPVDTLWADEEVRPLRHCTREELDVGYPTQKPEGLLRRVVEWTTRRGDLVMDLFCGSGTTLAVAAKLGRAWVGCDVGEHAVRVCRERMTRVCGEVGGGGRVIGVIKKNARVEAGVGEGQRSESTITKT
ncbi:MAG TPA: site-specific DNA-methyltransferase [Phycisphaerales bacterium]|nr:site-specific DNA-methyltransferase [Phycisphaerales bacterium]